MSTLRALALLPLFPLVVSAGVQHVWWNITYTTSNPDNLFPRTVIGVNGTWPPPPVEVNTTDSLVLHVLNSLDEPTTLHHHGMFMNGTSWADGVMGVSQCGIPPGQEFDYVVPINSSGQWGTYWIHAHLKGHLIDGLRAPLILHPPVEFYASASAEQVAAGLGEGVKKPNATYDDEFTVVLGDWYHDRSDKLVEELITFRNPAGAEPVPDSGLVYFSHGGAYLQPRDGTNRVGFNENASLPFQPGKSYRLRLINTGAFATFNFWIDGHDMTIIEVDGTDIEEFPVDHLAIAVGQRYSVLVTARNDTSSNATDWAIHANMDPAPFYTIPDTLQLNITSRVSYGANLALSNLGDAPSDAYSPIDDFAMVPIISIGQVPATRQIELDLTFDTMDDGTNRGMFNQTTYNDALVPTILSELSLGQNAAQESAYGPSSLFMDHLEVVDLVLKNDADLGKATVLHLHGHKAALVHRSDAGSSSDPSAIQEGQVNPMRRDTVYLPAGGEVVLRFIADNPGAWLLRSQNEFHFLAGSSLRLIESPLQAQERSNGSMTSSSFSLPPPSAPLSGNTNNITISYGPPPTSLVSQCQALNIPTSGNAARHGDATSNTADLSNLKGMSIGPFVQKLGWHSKGIGAMAGAVLSAVVGMCAVCLYALTGPKDDEENVVSVMRQTGWRRWKKV